MNRVQNNNSSWITYRDAWDALPMESKAEMMKVAVKNGIYDLQTIREKYNEFAEGGSKEEVMEDNTNKYKDGGSIHIKKSHRGRLTELKRRTGKTEAELYRTGGPSVRKMITFARSARKWKHGDGGELDTYDEPQTFAGRMAEAAGASPSIVRGTDVVSSVAQMTPWGHYIAATDLGRDLNRVYHKEKGAKKDVALDLLSMIPGISAPGLKAAENAWNTIRGNSKIRKALNTGIITGKVADFVDDTWGANKTSKAFGGNLFDGTSQSSQQMNIFRRPSGEYFYQASPESEKVTVVPRIKVSDDPAYWTYADASGKLYTPKQTATSTQGEVIQTEAPSTWENIIVASNNNYMNPVLGAPARWKASWNNNTNAIRALWDNPAVMGHPLGMAAKAVEHLAGDEGISKTIRLYQNSDGSDNARWLWQRSLAGDALESLGLLPAANQAYKIGRTYLNNNYIGAFGKPTVTGEYAQLTPTTRTRIGDVEIDNPNLLYHLDRGDGAGAFSTQGAYIEDGFLFPGTSKDASATPYSWWNKGKPYATAVHGQPMTRLMTTTEDTPGILHVRSQNYPIGQWDGKKGFVLKSEYVSPKPVNVAGSTYRWRDGYGWKKEVHNPRQSMTWGKAQTIFSDNYTESPYNNLGSFTWNSTPFEKPSINTKSPQIGNYIREGSEQAVYNAAKNADEVKKVQLRRGFSTIDDIRNFHRTSGFMNRNKVPFHERLSISGYLTNPETNSIYPVYSQGKLNPFIEPTTELISQEQLFEWENVIAPEIKEMMRKRGYVGDVNNGFKGPMYVGDIHPRNIGFNKNGQIRIFDLSIE